MNYLAHAFLSFQNEEVLFGNMISDFVKGKNKFAYSSEIQQGITLHRAIDAFTDSHPTIKDAKQIFQQTYRLYSGAFIDVVLDHFLAKHLQEKTDLLLFTQKTYSSLEKYTEQMPVYFQKMFPNMQQNNWLYNYQFNWGIQKSFIGLQRRATYIAETETAYQLFIKEYRALQECFNIFFKEVYNNAAQEYKNLTNVLPNALY
jgi:acyl carrier protein phosphodiesterase